MEYAPENELTEPVHNSVVQNSPFPTEAKTQWYCFIKCAKNSLSLYKYFKPKKVEGSGLNSEK